MGYFGSNYYKSRPSNNHGQEPATRKKFNRHKENNDIVNHEVDDIILQKNNKASSEYEAHENIDDEVDENDLYQIDNMSLDDKKEITE